MLKDLGIGPGAKRKAEDNPLRLGVRGISSALHFAPLHHLLDQPPKSRHRQESECRGYQTHHRTVGDEIENGSNNGETGRCRHDSPCEIVPKSVENVDCGKSSSGLQRCDETGSGRYREKEHCGNDGCQWMIAVGGDFWMALASTSEFEID